MKTVGEFKKAGLVFVKGDTCKEQKGTTYVAGRWIEYENQGDDDWIDDIVIEFSWRENTGVKPEFSGAIDAIIGVGDDSEQIECAPIDGFSWDLDHSYPTVKWRPSLNQPSSDIYQADESNDTSSISVEYIDTKEPATHNALVDLQGDLSNAEKHDRGGRFLVVCIKDGISIKKGEYQIASHTTNNTEYWENVCAITEFTDYCEKMAAEEKRMDIIGQNGNDGLHYDNTAQQVEVIVNNNTQFSVELDEKGCFSWEIKSASSDKPIFTQAMADNGELPPVGSLFIDIEYNENKQVLALAHHLGKVVYAADYDDVSQVEYFHADQDCCCPLDTRTDREKAIDAAFISVNVDKETIGLIYDIWNCKIN